MKKERYYLLDALRGLTLCSMILYHGMYDFVEIYGVSVNWFFKLPGYIWQQSICWTFIFLSGFCWKLGRQAFRRGMLVFASGLLVSIVTSICMPSQRILFGILTFMGSAMLFLIPVEKYLGRIPMNVGFLVSALCFFLCRNINTGFLGFESLMLGKVPEFLYQGKLMTFLGFPESGFYSSDYFSFFPWIFLFLCGYYFHGIFFSSTWARFILRVRCKPLEWMGRNSLWIYLLHQPFLMIVLEIYFLVDFF